jgi:hypothetical protein
MSRSIVIIAAVAAIFAAGVLLGRADAGASSSAPSKYAKASAGSSQSSAVRYGRGRWLTDFSSSARRR